MPDREPDQPSSRSVAGATSARSGSAFMRYLAVGGAGFVIDASLLTLLTVQFQSGLLLGRATSFTIATLSTWLLNRTFVFPSGGLRTATLWTEYGRYISVQIAGAVTNLAVFFALIGLFPFLTRALVFPLAVGAVCALGITFIGSRHLVFNPRPHSASSHDFD